MVHVVILSELGGGFSSEENIVKRVYHYSLFKGCF